MGAFSSEILHFLKVKLPLQNDQRWLPLLSWISKFSPSFRSVLSFYSTTLLNTGLVEKVRYTTQGVKTHTKVVIWWLSICCTLYWSKTGLEKKPGSFKKRLENSMFICSLFLLEFQRNNLYCT